MLCEALKLFINPREFPLCYDPLNYTYPKKDNRAKVIYSYFPGTLEQIITTGYPVKSLWRDRIFSVIGECIVKYPEKKSELRLLVNELISLTDDEIAVHLACAVTQSAGLARNFFNLPELYELTLDY